MQTPEERATEEDYVAKQGDVNILQRESPFRKILIQLILFRKRFDV